MVNSRYIGDTLKTIVVEKKVDPQGRLMLPAEWRYEELGKSGKVLVIADKNCIRVYPMNKIKLTDFFDKAKPNDEINPFRDYKGALAKASLRVSR